MGKTPRNALTKEENKVKKRVVINVVVTVVANHNGKKRSWVRRKAEELDDQTPDMPAHSHARVVISIR